MKNFQVGIPHADKFLVLITMFFAAILVISAALLSQSTNMVAAATCWRGTTCSGPIEPSFPGSWDSNNFSPASRFVSPERILTSDGHLVSTYPGNASLPTNNSILIFDFGKEVGGIIRVTYSAIGTGTLGLAFSEAFNWTGPNSDDSNGQYASPQNPYPDGALFANFTSNSNGNYTMPDAKMRGGFRYLTLFQSKSNAALDILDVTCEISFAPAWSNLRAYRGYFNSSDELLNRIWYAGAYTLQTNAIPPSSGRRFPINPGWENDQNLNLGTDGTTIYVDGSKRDRTVWAGDLAIAVPSILLSTGDWDGVRNTLQVLLNDQATSGALPFAGPGLNIYNSDTYHMATMIGIYEYYLFTGDDTFLSANWGRYQNALNFITAKIDNSGLLYVTGTDDWGRIGQGAHNTEANMIMYKTLTSASSLAGWMNDTALASNLTTTAATLKKAVNVACWDPAVGAFGDSEGDNSRHPQDGNSMALFFGAANDSYVQRISQQLTTNWISIGSVAPELSNNLIGFGQSFEIKAHLLAQQASRALDLTRRAWGWYLDSPSGTASTCIEGYLSDGSFGYRSLAGQGYNGDYSYTSHAHGWSTGPVDALTSYIVGLQLTSPGGKTWSLRPQFGDLSHAEAGFTTPLGKFSASWSRVEGGYSINWGFPGNSVGTLELPSLKTKAPTVVMDKEDGERMMVVGTWDGERGIYVVRGLGGSGGASVTF